MARHRHPARALRRTVLRAGAGLAGLLGAVALGASFHPAHGAAGGRVEADAALVLSGDVEFRRAARAVELYAAGQVGYVVLTGRGAGGDSAAVLAERCARAGVPRERLLMETTSTSTRENMQHVAPLLRARRFRRVALVTSASHLGRAERAARRVMPEVEWVPVPVPDVGPLSRIVKTRLGEWVKLAAYLARGWA
jgi:uncharacterized SAM-binding protein YcdF (DUF218 family)